MCKTAIKLLLVFVEYTDTNCLLLIKAINEVDKELGVIPWSNIITTIQNANKDSSKRIGNYSGSLTGGRAEMVGARIFKIGARKS